MEGDNRTTRMSPGARDDGYWSALFEHEESFLPPSPPLTDDVWAPAAPRADGHSAWTDGHKADLHNPWKMAADVQTADHVLKLRVTGFNKGGLLVQWQGLQGFVPASQLVDFPQFHVERERMRALAGRQDATLQLKIIEVNEETNRLILSERAAQVNAETRQDLLAHLREGETVRGRVTNLTDFGAFVDLGGVEGLIHISELSWSRVVHPNDIVKPGEEIEVIILNIDPDNARFALSLKRLKRDPWRTAEQRYQAGQLVEGSVSNVTSFGAFVLLEEELEGLIHISELAEGAFLHPRNVVRVGDQVTARVLHVDSAKKRLALSLRGAPSPI